MKIGRKADGPAGRGQAPTGKVAPVRRRSADASARKRHPAEAPARKRRPADGPARGGRTRSTRESHGQRQGPQTAPVQRPIDRTSRPKSTTQAKARSKARKAKAPKVVRPSLQERLILKLDGVDLRPQALLARIPFVMLVIGALALGLGITLWLSTASAQRSYQLGSAREVNSALAQQKEALERDVLEAQSAPALADAARNLGMIPSRDTAHLVQDQAGNWVVVGMPKPAAGAPPPPLNTKLPDPTPPAPPAKPAVLAPPVPKPGASAEVPRRITPSLPGSLPSNGVPMAAGAEVPVLVPSVAGQGVAHAPIGVTLPGPPPLPGPAAVLPAGDTLAIAPAAPVVLPVPTVAAVPVVPAVPDVAAGVVPVGPAQ